MISQQLHEGDRIVSLAKGHVPPEGTPPTLALEAHFGPERVACVGGPAHAREMVEGGAGLVCASHAPALAEQIAETFRGARVVCEDVDRSAGTQRRSAARPIDSRQALRRR